VKLQCYIALRIIIQYYAYRIFVFHWETFYEPKQLLL